MSKLLNGEHSRLDGEANHFNLNNEILKNEIQVSSSVNSTSPQQTTDTVAKGRWAWTGFTNKTLWDWLQFITSLAASIALPIIFTVYTSQQQEASEKNRKSEHEIAISNQEHSILTDYLDDMTDLMLKEDLGKPSSEEPVKLIASARTLNTLRQIDGGRKGQLLKFLYEAELIGRECKPNPTTLEAQNCQSAILDLEGAKLENVTIESPIRLQGIDLNNVLLAKANLPKIDLTKADMQQADLRGANLTGALLTEARLERSNMENAILVRAFLRGADLSSVKLTGANLQDAIMGKQKESGPDGTLLEAVKLIGATLRKANLKGVDLTQAKLNGANFQEANLSNATLTGANLQNSILIGADLSNANLQQADLRNADLTTAILTGSDLKEAMYNGATRFPEGFSPDGRGMIEQQ